MNRGEIKTMVKRLFGDTTGAQITDSDIESWIELAQVDIARRTECLKRRKETTVVNGDASYTLPADCVSVDRVSLDGKKLDRISIEELDELNQSHENVLPSAPRSYYLWGDTIYLYPPPAHTSEDGLDIHYIASPSPLTTDDSIPDVPVVFHEDIVKYCLALAKDLDEETQAASTIRGEYEQRLIQGRYEELNKFNGSYPAVRVLPWDGGDY